LAISTAAGTGAIATVGSGTTAGVGVPVAISGSGSARLPGLGRPLASSSVPNSSVSWTRNSAHMPEAKCG